MYRTIDASFWTDAKVRKLKPEGRLLFLYLITNPHTHVSGIYYLPTLIAQHETGLNQKNLESAITALTNAGLCLFDRPNQLVWVVRMFRFQGSGPKNTLSAAHHLSKDVHNSFLVNEFVKVYPEVSAHLKNRVPIGYPTHDGGATPDSPFPIPEPENGTQIPEHIAQNQKQPFGPHGNVSLSSEEFDKLVKQFGLPGTHERISAMDLYFGSKGIAGKYKSHYLTLLNWERKNGGRSNGQQESSEEAKIRRTREASERLLTRIAQQNSGSIPS